MPLLNRLLGGTALGERLWEQIGCVRLEPEANALRWEGHFDAGLVKRMLDGCMNPVEHLPGVDVGLDPPSHTKDPGRISHLDVEDLHGLVREALAPAKRPREFRFADSLPMNPNGKTDLDAIRGLFL